MSAATAALRIAALLGPEGDLEYAEKARAILEKPPLTDDECESVVARIDDMRRTWPNIDGPALLRAVHACTDTVVDERPKVITTEPTANGNGTGPPPEDRFTSLAITLEEFLIRPYPKPRSLWGKGILSAGDLCFLYGRPGIGKTWLMKQWILDLCQGVGAFGLPGPESGPLRIGVLEMELSGAWFQERIETLLQGRSRDFGGRLRVVVRPDLKGAVDLLKDDWKALKKWCREAELDMLWIDALSRAHSTDENKAVEFGPVLNRLDDIRFDTETSIVCVHHEPKTQDGKERDDMDALRGSSRMQSDANALIRFVRAGSGGHMFNLRFPKLNNAADPGQLWMVRGKQGFEVIEAPELRKEGNIEKVRVALTEAGSRGLSDAEICETTGLSKPTVAQHRKTLDAVADGEEYTVQDKSGRTRSHRRWIIPPEPTLKLVPQTQRTDNTNGDLGL